MKKKFKKSQNASERTNPWLHTKFPINFPPTSKSRDSRRNGFFCGKLKKVGLKWIKAGKKVKKSDSPDQNKGRKRKSSGDEAGGRRMTRGWRGVVWDLGVDGGRERDGGRNWFGRKSRQGFDSVILIKSSFFSLGSFRPSRSLRTSPRENNILWNSVNPILRALKQFGPSPHPINWPWRREK